MKVSNHRKTYFTLLLLVWVGVGKLHAQDSSASTTILALQYFLPENNVPFIDVTTKKKTGRKFEPVKDVVVNVYLNEIAAGNLLGKVVTEIHGQGRVAFPASLKAAFDSLDEFTIVAESVPTGKEEALSAELTIKKAMLSIDTSFEDGVRTVSAQLKEKKGNKWLPVGDVEMKLRIKRLLSNLSVGEEETYTADSAGTASAPFMRDSIPGDEKGNITLLAKVEENDTYGNLEVQKQAPWGIATKMKSNFWHRTLWSTGNRAPIWLLVIAFSIIVGVWGTVIYLVGQVIKIKKMGRQFDLNVKA
ncbi:hypothetical protein BH11BAC3_BH11BAC3_17460 [soil metagenome]